MGLPVAASSLLWFLAVFLGTLWLRPVLTGAARRHVADLTSELESLGFQTEDVNRYMVWWLAAMAAIMIISMLSRLKG